MARPLTICHQPLAISHQPFLTGVGASPPPDPRPAAVPVLARAVRQERFALQRSPPVPPPAGFAPAEPCAEPPYHRSGPEAPEAGWAPARSRVDPCVECDTRWARDSPEPLARTAALPRPALRRPVDLALGAAWRRRNASGRLADYATIAGQSSADRTRLRAVSPEPGGSLPDAGAVAATLPAPAGAPRCRRRRRCGR
jgi:hypothetical protein